MSTLALFMQYFMQYMHNFDTYFSVLQCWTILFTLRKQAGIFLPESLALCIHCAMPCCSEGTFGIEYALHSLCAKEGSWVCPHSKMASQKGGLYQL